MKREVFNLINSLWLVFNYIMFFILPFSASDIGKHHGWGCVLFAFLILFTSTILNDLFDKYIKINKGVK